MWLTREGRRWELGVRGDCGRFVRAASGRARAGRLTRKGRRGGRRSEAARASRGGGPGDVLPWRSAEGLEVEPVVAMPTGVGFGNVAVGPFARDARDVTARSATLTSTQLWRGGALMAAGFARESPARQAPERQHAATGRQGHVGCGARCRRHGCALTNEPSPGAKRPRCHQDPRDLPFVRMPPGCSHSSGRHVMHRRVHRWRAQGRFAPLSVSATAVERAGLAAAGQKRSACSSEGRGSRPGSSARRRTHRPQARTQERSTAAWWSIAIHGGFVERVIQLRLWTPESHAA